MNSSFKVAAATALLMLGGTSLASANVITAGDGATGTGPYNLVANSVQVDSYVNVDLSTAISFSTITSLSALFNDTLGGSAAGSPRIELDATNGDFFNVYLGTPPSFNNNVAGLNAFSGVNLDNGTGNSAFKNTGSYVTLASLQSTFGTDQINAIAFILEEDSSVSQQLTLNGLSLNGTNLLPAAAPVPEPITLSLFGVGVVGAAALRRRKAKKS